MTEEMTSIVLEHLRHIRRKVDQTADDVIELKHRVTRLEHAMSSVKYEFAYCTETDSLHQISIDKICDRLDRIERRLDLTD